jgi:hypothetical protein
VGVARRPVGRSRASTKQKRADRRGRYEDKVSRKAFDEFNTQDLIEFWADLYKLKYGVFWVHESQTLCNLVFGRLLECYGPRSSLNYIAAALHHRNPPRSVTWFNGPAANELADPGYRDDLEGRAQELLASWRTMTGAW